MSEAQVHHWLVISVFVFAAVTFLALQRLTAPYGRFTRPGWGPSLPSRLAWVVFESPAVIAFAAIYLVGDNAPGKVPLALFALWQLHYVMRAFVFPLRMRESARRIPVAIVLLAVSFNLLNAYVNARWISQLGHYPASWLQSPAFLAGSALFLGGFVVNQLADRTLRELRRPGETGYRIPRGGLYRWISCPNYLGEILAWSGWAIATWSLAGLSFAVFTAANLVPRAIATHRWYRARFDDYPHDRRAIIPGAY